jgi:hypothetical protein
MKRILFPAILIATLALLLGIGVVACGDDDDDDDGGTATSTAAGDGATSLGAYLREVNDIQEGVSEATDSIGEEVWDDPPRARQALSAAIDVAESAVTALEALNPPDEAVSAHQGLISAGDNLVAVATDYYDQLQDLQAGPAFDTFAEDAQASDSELSQALDEMVTACASMEEVSTENRAGVDLACPAPRS